MIYNNTKIPKRMYCLSSLSILPLIHRLRIVVVVVITKKIVINHYIIVYSKKAENQQYEQIVCACNLCSMYVTIISADCYDDDGRVEQTAHTLKAKNMYSQL